MMKVLCGAVLSALLLAAAGQLPGLLRAAAGGGPGGRRLPVARLGAV